MRDYRAVALVIGLLLSSIAFPATAQEAGDLARIYFVDPKPGMAGQLEDALKTHLEWRKQHNDSWAWATFHVVNGDNFGQYGIRSGGHTWADLDAYEMTTAGGPEGANHFTTTVGPYVESFRSSITRVNGAVSRMPQDLGGINLYSVTEFDVGLFGQFNAVRAKVHDAIGQAGAPNRYLWQDVVNGGSANAVLVLPGENWAAFAAPEKSIPEMLAEAYGADEATKILHDLASSIRSAVSYTVRLRRDLSLLPD